LNLEKPPRKTMAAGSKHMDENALEHLEFLNKLEETLAGLRSKR
jgi:hypothetical protein